MLRHPIPEGRRQATINREWRSPHGRGRVRAKGWNRMQAHRTTTTITEGHEIKVRLPSDSPAGEAEVIVIAEPPPTAARLGGTPATDLNSWLDGTLHRLPPAPSPQLESLRRETLYEVD